MIQDSLKPVSSKHSIKEAVISLFLVNPIIKPERFQKLISGALSGSFHLYENVNQVQIQINTINSSVQSTPPQGLIGGFKFIGFSEGKIGQVLQGVNEPNRNYISYHSLNYNRWNDFLQNYLEYIKIISNENNDIFIRAISIHYTDEFRWTGSEPMNLDEVFNVEAKYMSKAFFENANSSNFVFNTEKTVDKIQLIDRLEIKVNNKHQKNISISHNITKNFDDYKSLKDLLIPANNFDNMLTELHRHNKAILMDILNPDVKDLIGLKN